MHLATPLRRLSLRCLAAAFTLFAFAAPVAASGVSVGDLLVTSDATNVTRNYSGTTGNLQSVFTNSIGALGQMAVHIGIANGRVLIGHNGGGVEEFDAATGAYIKTYNAGGGWQWAGIYAPNGTVLIGDMGTNDVRRYHPVTGAQIGFLAPVPSPSDMEFGPNGNLYVCSFNAGVVFEIDPVTGNVLNSIPLPAGGQANDVAFNPVNSEMLVTDTRFGVVHRFSYPAYAPLGTFAGTSWSFPHGIVISPHTGRVLAIDGTTAQVHEFNQFTYVETNANFLSPAPGLKIVDLAFVPAIPTPVSNTSWGRVKALYK
ncbi:MAG: hypothetical protein ABIS67_06200 [Candidatus Eisenbacteria bacterium]